MKKVWNFLTSTRLMSVWVILFAFAMAVATFVENDFGTQSAKALIYNAWWFELIMALLTLSFIGNISKYRLYRREKWPVLTFHLAFIVVLLGAFVTRYFGYEGMMAIREGEVSNVIMSDKTYVNVVVDDTKEQLDFEKEVLFGALSNNHFSVKKDFRGQPFKVEYVDFIPNAKAEFKPGEDGVEHLHLVISAANGRQDVYIPNKEIVPVGNAFVSFNKPMKGVYNFITSPDGLFLQPKNDGTFMVMQTQERQAVPKDSLRPAELLKLYDFPDLGFVIPEKPVKGRKTAVSATKQEKSQYPYDALYVNVTSGDQTELMVLQGAKGILATPKRIRLNNLNFTLSYGAKSIKTPFGLKLRDFQLERYAGTNSPSSYASEVTVIDTDKTFDYRIYMNHVLDYRGFRFFQSSYDPDEKGTVLSVNHDFWGTLITYIGYALMGLAMLLTLMWKGTRFTKLIERLNKLALKKFNFVLIIVLSSTGLWAQNQPQTTAQTPQKIDKYVVAKEHADKFGRLLIQDHHGRIKPVNTYALQALRKVHKGDYYEGLTAEQVLLSAQLDPFRWGEEPIVFTKPNALGKTIAKDLQIKDGYTSAANFYKTGRYYFADKINTISTTKNMDRTATDKEIINLDDRFNVWVSVLNGSLMHIYPKAGDPNNTWYAGIDTRAFAGQDSMIVKMHKLYMTTLVNAVKTGDYTQADRYLDIIKGYQLKQGAEIIPPAKKTAIEIQYNRLNIFKKLLFIYLAIGLLLMILAFIELFGKPGRWLRNLIRVFVGLAILAMIAHVAGLGIRWYISGHAPWSNAHEALVFMAFVSVLVGVLFTFRRSTFIVSVAVVFAALLMGIAHGSSMNPEITNLVPVLKSYWLNIHVAVITASYMFLGLSALLGFINLLLYILRNEKNKERLDMTFDELTFVSEASMTIGLFALSIGTFLGGVWASESWGRYWSWDPKEVWSLISMVVYIFVLHMRLVPGLKGKFLYNLFSLWSITTLIMTFFGVNYYLSGMHSYAGGDPVPFPRWAWYAIVFFIIFSIVASIRYAKRSKS